MLKTTSVGILLSALLVLAAQAHPQTAIPDGPVCPACRITARVLFTMGALDGPGSLERAGSIALDSRRNFWYSQLSLPPEIFAGNGSFLRTLGGRGPGPGEYASGSSIVALPGDSTLVFDYGNRRAVVVDPEFAASRYIVVPFLVNDAIVVDWPRSLMVQAGNRAAANPGLPLHIVDMSGSEAAVLVSFGPDKEPLRSVASNERHRFARSASGQVWTLGTGDYKIRLWDPATATAVDNWVRNPDWFRNRLDSSVPANLQNLVEDRAGRLWVRISTPREGAAERMNAAIRPLAAAVPPGTPFEVSETALPPSHELYQSTIEILDVQRGRVYATTTLDYYLIALLRENLAVAYSQNNVGIPQLTVLELTLQDP